MTNTETPDALRNTEEQLVGPITHGGSDARYKLCRCSVCGLEAVCEPLCDFYTRPDDPTGPLFCEVCILLLNPKVDPRPTSKGEKQ